MDRGKSFLSWVGPAVMGGSVAYVYRANHPDSGGATTFPVSTRVFCLILFFMYATGYIPRCALFPDFFYRSNVFDLGYRVYCSKLVGFRLLRKMLHAPVPYSHSDYRVGVRAISGVDLPLWKKAITLGSASGPATDRSEPPPRGRRRTAAQELEEVIGVPVGANPFPPGSFYARGGGVVDVGALRHRAARTNGVLVIPVPMFQDNYAYLIVSLRTAKVVVVDPADPVAVVRMLNSVRAAVELPLVLTEVLTTHRHWDHAGGNEELRTYATGTHNQRMLEKGENVVSPTLRFIGPQLDKPLACTELVTADSAPFMVAGGGVLVQTLAVPGHTCGSVMFVVSDTLAVVEAPPQGNADSSTESSVEESPSAAAIRRQFGPQRMAVFTGDALFSGGLGAPFETTSVKQIIQTRDAFLSDSRLRVHPVTHQPVAPEDVLLYVGHEYTERLLEEVNQIMKKQLDKLEDPPQGAKAFQQAVAEALGEVKELRTESDGLRDAASVGEETPGRDGRPAFKLPSCTVPSTLAQEERINPLLTTDSAELDALAAAGVPFDAAMMERVVYCSLARHVAGTQTADKGKNK